MIAGIEIAEISSGVPRAGFFPVRDEVQKSSIKRASGGCLGAKRR